ncbi:MAG TPA: hypothetical protein VHD62_17770, partial [Opitutaceae bacterium]|nr:hypothetical protein [Opitutaceae bacterium]
PLAPAAPAPVRALQKTGVPKVESAAPPPSPGAPPPAAAPRALATPREETPPRELAPAGPAPAAKTEAPAKRLDFREDFGAATDEAPAKPAPIAWTEAPVARETAEAKGEGEAGAATEVTEVTGENVPAGLADALEKFAERDNSAEARAARRRLAEAAEAGERPFWLWGSLADSGRQMRRGTARGWTVWKAWRKTASFQVFVAFVAIYAALAAMRAPSEVVVEQSRHAEEMAFLQNFLKSYCAGGGLVLAERPHGGSELYPRGVLLQGEMLDAFLRAPVGGVFTTRVTSAASNPLAGFDGYPPIYAGGAYFHLERKFNLALYRCTFLVRKDSEQAGTMLVAKVELAY